jgi:hypothetical protein
MTTATSGAHVQRYNQPSDDQPKSVVHKPSYLRVAAVPSVAGDQGARLLLGGQQPS